MLTVGEVLNRLPYRKWNKLITKTQSDQDIIKELVKAHREFALDYDLIYKQFWTVDIYTTSEKIWSFLKNNFTYSAESIHNQTVRSPYRIIECGDKIDCKHYSLFAGGILDAIQRNIGSDGWDWFYRFASYNNDPAAAHVFVVVVDKDGEIWIDPVLDRFNEDKAPNYILDKKPMALYQLAGISDPKNIVVPMGQAFTSFLKLVNLNAFELAELMKAHPDVTTGPVFQYMNQQGFDYNHFMTVLNQAQK